MSDEVVGKNKVVYMTYSVLAENGQVMGQNDVPTGYVHGAGSGLFEKIERSLEGCKVGDRVEVSLTPEEGFGEPDPELILVEDLANVPPQLRRLGGEAEAQNSKGETITFRVVRIENGKVTLDGNNPLAGQNATCVVEILSLRDATPDEISSGFPAEQGPAQVH
jgi:FKBP-type peptidyl-prolyl cis-trans isomerase SlyD